MMKNIINALTCLFVSALLVTTGCGSSDSASNSSSNFITAIGWNFENNAPDYSNTGTTCALRIYVYYSESLAAGDIDSFIVTSQNQLRWTVPAANQLGTTSSGKPYVGARLVYSQNVQAFPLLGTWTVTLKLKNGQTSSSQLTLHEQGSLSSATHAYVYSQEDFTPTSNASQYIAALGRFPAAGFSLQYTAVDGGKITSSGLSPIMANFLAAEPNAYNMFCWLYDANKVYLGFTGREYSTIDHSASNLITSNGELSIVPAFTTASSGQVDLSQVKFIRIIYMDGAQYTPSSYANYDYRSVSAFVTVN